MPNIKTGQDFACPVCGKTYYRSGHEIKRGTRVTCGDRECQIANRTGQNNPFYGRKHTDETRRKIKEGRAKNPPKGTGPKKGVFKHTEEAKRKISEASRHLWAHDRDKMLASLPRGLDHVFAKNPEDRRYRQNFTPRQRREWLGSECAYCGGGDDLVLDHIIPVFDGGQNARTNAQTLCQPCNLWKVYKVDLPRYQAARAKGAEVNPS